MSVSIEKSDDIWTIIHNRPEARNAMDPESADALIDRGGSQFSIDKTPKFKR